VRHGICTESDSIISAQEPVHPLRWAAIPPSSMGQRSDGFHPAEVRVPDGKHLSILHPQVCELSPLKRMAERALGEVYLRHHRHGRRPMQRENNPLIRVHCEWDGWQTAEVRFSDLRDVHWFQPIRAPHPLVHAHVSCADLVRGTIPHDCGFSSVPHRLLVCVLKRHTIPTVYEELARRADEGQTLLPHGTASAGGTSATRGHRVRPYSIESGRLTRPQPD